MGGDGDKRAKVLEGVRILVVDDHADCRLLAQEMLTQAGGAVDAVPDGARALDAAAHHQYACILMDLDLPAMDGYETAAALRTHACKAPIIAFTACAMREERERCLAAGFDDVLTKPFRCADLVSAISKQLREHAGAKGKLYALPRQGPFPLSTTLPIVGPPLTRSIAMKVMP